MVMGCERTDDISLGGGHLLSRRHPLRLKAFGLDLKNGDSLHFEIIAEFHNCRSSASANVTTRNSMIDLTNPVRKSSDERR